MAVIQRYVNMASSPGGDGTTNATTGDNRAYASSAEAEAAEQTAFNGDNLVIDCDLGGGSADSALSISGSTFTAASDYMTWRANTNQSQEAVKTGWDASRYSIEGTDENAVQIYDDYVRFEGLQVKITVTGAGDGIRCASLSSGANYVVIKGCRILGSCSGTGDAAGIEIGDSDAVIMIGVTIITDIVSGADTGFAGILSNSATSIGIYKCNINKCGRGIRGITGAVDVVHSAVFDNLDDFNGTFNSISFCASDDGDGTDAISPDGSDWDNEYNDYSNGDVTLLSTGNCYHGGTSDQSGGVFVLDIDGDTFDSSSSSIGVDEYIAAGEVSGPARKKIGLGLFESPLIGGQLI